MIQTQFCQGGCLRETLKPAFDSDLIQTGFDKVTGYERFFMQRFTDN